VEFSRLVRESDVLSLHARRAETEGSSTPPRCGN